jgi:hypothetical protein
MVIVVVRQLPHKDA